MAISLAPAVRAHSWQADYTFVHWIGYGTWLVTFSVIHYQSQKQLPGIDPFLVPAMALLSGIGLVMIWRLEPVFGIRQSMWLVVSTILFWAGLRYSGFISVLRRYKYVWLLSGLLLTGLTFLFGTYPGGEGPNLWLDFGGIYLQPSEPLKLLLIIYLAAYFGDQTALKLRSLRLMAPTFILIAAALSLLLAQRDLGTALVFLLIYFMIGFLASGKTIILFMGSLFVGAAAVLGYQVFPVIQQRVNTWLNPWADPMGNSYQIVQSLIAIASGGLLGRGPGLGNPGLVPIAHSDFIFTSIAEEFGLTGTLVLMLTFALLTIRALVISIHAPNTYRRLLAAGLGVYFSIQALFIIAGNLNLVPLSGITLPFVSYGGSSLVVCFTGVVILAVISNQPERETSFAPVSRPYLLLGGILLSIWMAVALVNGYWTIIRSGELLVRSDNLRQPLGDLYAPRGNFLDRNNNPLTLTTGERGSYGVELIYPPLSHITGYSNLFYGQAGLQANLDLYLRGLQANAASEIWSNALLYSQRPPGMDVRLSIDVDLQKIADDLLAGTKGAVVLLNAETGEILTIASYPFYNANQLEENWVSWNNDPDAPFLNRALQGQYYPETALAAFVLYGAVEAGNIPAIPTQLSYQSGSLVIPCTTAPDDRENWGTVVSHGCPGAVMTLAENLGGEHLSGLYSQLGFFESPQLGLPVSEPDQASVDGISTYFVQDSDGIYVSPLQMALAAAAITTGGLLPEPTLVLAVHTPHQGWVILNQGLQQNILDRVAASQVVDMLSNPSSFYWQTIGYGRASAGELTTWYIGGTTSEWQGSPLAVTIVLERDDPELAERIGQELLNATIHPATP